jgi:ribonuclease HIII
LSNALKRRRVPEGLLDQFSKRPIVQGFIQREFPEFTLNMRTKAEEDPVVAAASIMARAEYIQKMKALSTEAAMTLPRGAGQAVKVAGIELFRRGGHEVLANYSKTHFKTFQEICDDGGASRGS